MRSPSGPFPFVVALETRMLAARPLASLNPALRQAVLRRDIRAARRLLDRSADPSAVCVARDTALHIAARKCDASCLFLMICASKPLTRTSSNVFGETPFTCILAGPARRRVQCARLLVASGLSQGGKTPLIAAVRAHEPSAVRALAASGADLDARDPHGRTALLVSVVVCCASPTSSSRRGLLALLLCGADVDATDARGIAPVHHAAMCRDTWCLEALVSAGADLSVPDCTGRPAVEFLSAPSKSFEVLAMSGCPPALDDRRPIAAAARRRLILESVPGSSGPLDLPAPVFESVAGWI